MRKRVTASLLSSVKCMARVDFWIILCAVHRNWPHKTGCWTEHSAQKKFNKGFIIIIIKNLILVFSLGIKPQHCVCHVPKSWQWMFGQICNLILIRKVPDFNENLVNFSLLYFDTVLVWPTVFRSLKKFEQFGFFACLFFGKLWKKKSIAVVLVLVSYWH